MKLVFSTLDVVAMVEELRSSIIGCRVNNVYDVNNKTYLLRLTKDQEKMVVLFESGARFHFTEFQWNKNMMPSGFSMKMRKHIRNRKVHSISQIGLDRIVDIQFGFEETSFHLIVELYDRGNMCLTDHTYNILHLLRPRTDTNQDVRYAAHERYPIELARPFPTYLSTAIKENKTDLIESKILPLLADCKGPWTSTSTQNQQPPVEKFLSTQFGFGQATVDHCCRLAHRNIQSDRTNNEQVAVCENDMKNAYARHFSNAMLDLLRTLYGRRSADQSEAGGYLFGKKQNPDDTELLTQEDIHPFLFDQHRCKSYITFPTFSKAVDAFYSKIESQKANQILAQNEKKAQRKMENIKMDHDHRLSALRAGQELEVRKGQLLEVNQELVNNIILMINHALCNQMDWLQLESSCMEAKQRGDRLALHIVQFNLQSNQLTVRLNDPFDEPSSSAEDDVSASSDFLDVVIDLDENALSNSRKYYDRKRFAVKKEEKTLVASRKALKSAAHKAEQTRKDIKTVIQISKIRKPMWFEKFFWFISSENYLIVAGRDSQQNEVLVKRHLGPNDIYVHADLHGASSVIVKGRPLTLEESGPQPLSDQTDPPAIDSTASNRLPLPSPKTLTEAGVMAITMSSAWNARVITSAWWVRPEQVSKTAPTGEYLTTGAFMIRGRKNYLPPCHFVYGFGILFKLDNESVEHHKGERRVLRTDNMIDNNQSDNTAPTELSEPEEVADVSQTASFPNAQLHLDLINLANRNHQHAVTIAHSRGKRQPAVRKPVPQQSESKPTEIQNEQNPPTGDDNQRDSGFGALKRGQKAKLKKIKQKYAEQDESERLMRMRLLQGDKAKLSKHHRRLEQQQQQNLTTNIVWSVPVDVGITSNELVEEANLSAPKDDENTEVEKPDTDDRRPSTPEDKQQEEVAEAEPQHNGNDQDDEQEEEEDKRTTEDDSHQLLDTLTGQPNENDILLYALPVCAPYTALANYKFKVKLTPGPDKRGKAAKTALHYFLTDRSTSGREKELLRVMKGEDVSRNFPGCVKVSHPQGNQQIRKR